MTTNVIVLIIDHKKGVASIDIEPRHKSHYIVPECEASTIKNLLNDGYYRHSSTLTSN